MSFRSIIISNPARLYSKNNQLVIANDELYQVPIEDITTIMIEGNGVTLTNRLLSKLCDNNVITYVCNDKYIPNAVVLPLNSHYKSYRTFKNQLNQSEAFKKRIWQMIVKQKLYNQGECLKLCGKNENELKALSKKVESGDKGNKEAIGAKFYFHELFGKEFARNSSSGINSALNYGYTILRGAIARTLVSYGFNTVIGVNHCNELNNFNLADDFIEPFRPIIDLWTFNNVSKDDILDKDHRISLVDLLNYECIIAGQKHSVLNAIDKMISSYSSCCEKKDYSKLLLPRLIELEYHLYE
ncbi:type II CRISPR-associated endonuclease Cas1 [Clostridium paraputrificum]|uniref:type II CRISPR-associated endonuclease Cas1 n=1 Tax=Clostridium paraputrificum TaxID=29363 RepID=UPI00232D84A8|nr:type II CRISPR-associated endonuclease Cas1 [Clostridium paraputrificum]MDB2107404.1 type II CRISPR-associated endonuclease Cas1 [Clostridium paraputrificum]MDB2114068.1 type II CRISPR-associated endonuclease Cas1 [Clostridium paraputrificum]